ncbi:MAG TPA: tetratricopeptide repeat protein [Aggregatilineaceae bacterium]|jgi:tetratricopeptide (TPR) repeat protein|nr:tetratricopeptide repeat protein [Aggregatilineaceae bacterium]
MTTLSLIPDRARSLGRCAALLVILIAVAALNLPASPVQAQDPLPTSGRLTGLRHVYQTWNNCSGANLTMAMSYFGWNHDQDVARQSLKPNVEDKNVSPGEMAAFVNQQTEIPNMRALWRYGGTIDLIKGAIAAGFPIIAETGFDVEDLGWMGHYETVVAYDDNSQTLWVYDSYLGLGSDGMGIRHTYAEFDSWWRHFNRTFVLLFPLDRESDVRAMLGPYVDPLYAAQSALDRARQEATANPSDGWAWFDMGTSYDKLADYADAATAFDEAFRLGMPWRLMWYMFSPYDAYFRMGRFNDVITLANNTETTTAYVEETFYWRGVAYAALGQRDAALNEFSKALAFNPLFADAQMVRSEVENGTFVAAAAP